MPRQKLEQLLRELEQQVREADLDSEQARAQLRSLQQAIQQRLEGKPMEEQSLIDSAGEALREFEDKHPTLTLTLGRIMDQLSKLGI